VRRSVHVAYTNEYKPFVNFKFENLNAPYNLRDVGVVLKHNIGLVSGVVYVIQQAQDRF